MSFSHKKLGCFVGGWGNWELIMIVDQTIVKFYGWKINFHGKARKKLIWKTAGKFP